MDCGDKAFDVLLACEQVRVVSPPFALVRFQITRGPGGID